MADLETTSTKHTGTLVSINKPGSLVGNTNFRIEGTAHVRMHTKTFIKIGGQGHTFEENFDDGSAIKKIEVRLGNSDPRDATLQPQGDRVRWHLDVTGASAGPLEIEVTATGTVTESSSTTVGNNEPEFTQSTKAVQQKATKRVTIDDVAPTLEISNLAISKSPPWFVAIQGTASDIVNVEKVQWSLDEAESQLAQNKSGDWSEWTANIALPNRNEPHEIVVVATDNVGNFSEKLETIPADTSHPMIVFSEPNENPHKELWKGEPITLEVSGMAFDTDTTVESVRFQHNDGELSDAENLSGDWLNWRVVVVLDRSGTHFILLSATDVVGNNSDDVPTKLTVIVEEVLGGDS